MHSNDPVIWGPALWRSLHTMAENIEDTESAHAFAHLVQSLQYTLPCKECKKHLILYIQKKPVVLYSKQDCIQYIDDLHTDVNTRLGKTTVTKATEKLCTTCSSSQKFTIPDWVFYCLLVFFLILALLFY